MTVVDKLYESEIKKGTEFHRPGWINGDNSLAGGFMPITARTAGEFRPLVRIEKQQIPISRVLLIKKRRISARNGNVIAISDIIPEEPSGRGAVLVA